MLRCLLDGEPSALADIELVMPLLKVTSKMVIWFAVCVTFVIEVISIVLTLSDISVEKTTATICDALLIHDNEQATT